MAQETIKVQDKYTAHNKGKYFVSWGGNRDSYTKSNINFRGDDYDFTIYDVTAHDKPKGWHVDYVNPGRMTIPQTNFRAGYFIDDHYSISVGWDHMKYVIYQYKAVDINGYYPNPGTYDETLPNNQVLLTEKFLTFEHTDGLNYVNTEFSRFDDVSKYIGINNTDKLQINLTEGVGAGFLFPKTNTKLLGKDRHDDFHVSGYGVSLKAGINVTFLKHFYVQGELKGGYINMPDIRTTKDPADRASQEFFFFQRIIAFGGIFKI
ncbi:hypothetical protein [Flavobacterium sp.]|uniref:hypothetical protein n=1 Tax=Flavobacterium sp. TaxID=239 RepID=UPI00286AEDD6|nr:hypothetical protein [Flavobacterium sp.]